MYKVIKYFTDLQDSNHAYEVGDEFPREGMDVSEDRIAELAGPDNKQGTPLIELVPEKPTEGAQEPSESEAEEVPDEESGEPTQGEDAATEEKKPKRSRKR